MREERPHIAAVPYGMSALALTENGLMELQEPPPDPFAGMTPEERKELLAGQGCCSECRMNQPTDSDATAASRAILDLCPDDLDGAAALMEDMGLEP